VINRQERCPGSHEEVAGKPVAFFPPGNWAEMESKKNRAS
jgi:hypothetical protein